MAQHQKKPINVINSINKINGGNIGSSTNYIQKNDLVIFYTLIIKTLSKLNKEELP